MSALHVPILRGRDISDADVAGRPDVILISEPWPGSSGRARIHRQASYVTFLPGALREVVGVVGDVKLDSLDQTRPNAALYFPRPDIPSSNGDGVHFR